MIDILVRGNRALRELCVAYREGRETGLIRWMGTHSRRNKYNTENFVFLDSSMILRIYINAT